jgi:transcriptional regulator with XRE-family HTH domain
MTTMARRRVKLSDQIRRAIDDSGMTRHRICKEIGMADSTMSRFMSGHCGLSLATLDELADLLGLEITARGRRERKGR